MISDRRTFLAGCAALGVVACGPREKNGRVKLVLADQVQLQQAKLEAAGALDGLGYDIAWANFAGAAPLLEALNAGAVDTGIAGDLPVVLAAAAGAPLKLVAAARSSARGIAIIVPEGSGIRSVAELRGRRVIVSSARGSISHYLLLEALREAGVSPKALTIGFMLPNDAAAAFAAGQIEAWATFGTYQATAESQGARILRDGTGINTGFGLIAASQAALDHPGKRAAITDYLGRLKRACDWSRAHKEEYAGIFAKRTGVPPAIGRVIAERENPELVPVDASVIDPLQRITDRFHSYGELPRHVTIKSIVDAGMFPK